MAESSGCIHPRGELESDVPGIEGAIQHVTYIQQGLDTWTGMRGEDLKSGLHIDAIFFHKWNHVCYCAKGYQIAGGL